MGHLFNASLKAKITYTEDVKLLSFAFYFLSFRPSSKDARLRLGLEQIVNLHFLGNKMDWRKLEMCEKGNDFLSNFLNLSRF